MRNRMGILQHAIALLLLAGTPSTLAQARNYQATTDDPQASLKGTDRAGNVQADSGQATFEKIKALAGEWEAPLDDGGKMINIFIPFAYGTKVFAQEWENGKYITSTIFYMVGSQLWADHFCDFKNEPRYAVKTSPNEPNVLRFEFRYATNLDAHPLHFHSTTWTLVDSNHLIQDWYIKGDKKPTPRPVHMEFSRTALSVRPDGSPAL